MTPLKFISLLLLITLYSCDQKTAKYRPDPNAVNLNNEAMALVRFIENTDSSLKAISLLEKATEIDSNYFLGHFNKLMFLFQTKQFYKAINTNNKLIQLRPFAHDLYLRGGFLYEEIGDSVSAAKYFRKSLALVTIPLDTMNKKNTDFEMFTINKAINLIMLNESVEANKILKVLYNNTPDNPEFDNVEKKLIESLMNKNKKELLDTYNSQNKQIDTAH